MRNLQILSWALYDLADQFFALNIVSLYFVRWLTLEKKVPEIFYSASFAISTLLVAVSGPILGAYSDMSSKRKPFLIAFTLVSAVFTMILAAGGRVMLALLFFIIANFGCQTATIFYNALMKNIAPEDKLGLVSGLGRMFGYTGAIIALLVTKPIVLKSGYAATFLPTGLLFLLFALPCMVFVKDKVIDGKHRVKIAPFTFSTASRFFKMTILNTDKFRGLENFFRGIFFGLCAVNTVILFMSVYATRVFGLNETQIINLVAFSTFFAMFGSVINGFLSDLLGHRNALIMIFISWIICFLTGALAANIFMYFFVGALAGFSLGGTWVISRALAFKLIPENNIGQIFGLFNFIGYISAVIGSLFWGLLLLVLGPLGALGYRIALLSLVLFMLTGFIFILRIPKNLADAH